MTFDLQRASKTCLRLAIASAMLVAISEGASAQAVITSTDGTYTIALGVNPLGELNVPSGTDGFSTQNAGEVGIAYFSDVGDNGPGFYDATSPGCLCEGWGVSASGVSGFANQSSLTAGLAPISFASDASSITSSVSVTGLPGLSVTQAYSAAIPGRLFENNVTITNDTGGDLTDLRYVRVMDWDVPFNEFAEHVTIAGTGTTTLLEESHNDGFETSDPLSPTTPIDPATLNVDFTDLGPADHGAYFKFNFGDLLDGESYEFTVFYGAAPNEADMLAALAAEDAELYSLGQSSDGGMFPGDPALGTPITFAFGFKGVGGVPIDPEVPEPTSLLVWSLLGLTGIAAPRRRRRTAKS